MAILSDLKPKSSWQEFLEQAKGYHRTAAGGRKRPQVFTPVILYNIIAMAIEKYCMAYLMFKKYLPQNHTMQDMVEALQKVGDLDQDLADEMIAMDAFQEICSVDEYTRRAPADQDISAMLDTCERLGTFVMHRLPTSDA